jgi:hypothetical protein
MTCWLNSSINNAEKRYQTPSSASRGYGIEKPLITNNYKFESPERQIGLEDTTQYVLESSFFFNLR